MSFRMAVSNRRHNIQHEKNSDGTFSGFAYSRRSNRSFTRSGTDAALDSNRFSVYTPRPNQTEVYAVACVKDDDVYFTLDKAAVVEHILVANTTYAYFAMNYGKDTGPTPIANPNVPSAPKGIWQTYAPGVERALNLDGDYFKLIIKGFWEIATREQLNFTCAAAKEPIRQIQHSISSVQTG